MAGGAGAAAEIQQKMDALSGTLGGGATKSPLSPGYGGPAEASGYAYVIGAILVVIVLVALLNAVNPANKLDYITVVTASLAPSSSQAYDALRTDDVLQLVMLVVGVLIAAVLGMGRRNKLLGNIIFGVAAVAALALIVFRAVSVLHLDIYFWLLALFYIAIAASALFIAVEFFIRATSGGERLVGALMVLLGILFGAAAFGAITVAVNVKSGDDAQAAIDAAHSSGAAYENPSRALIDLQAAVLSLSAAKTFAEPTDNVEDEPGRVAFLRSLLSGVREAVAHIPGATEIYADYAVDMEDAVTSLNNGHLGSDADAAITTLITGLGPLFTVPNPNPGP